MWRLRAVALCGVCWTLSGCVKEGAVLWYDIAATGAMGSSGFATTTTYTVPDSSSDSTTVPERSTGSSESSQGVSGTADAVTDATGESTLDTGPSSESGENCVTTRGGEGPTLIDDLEDGDDQLPTQDGRRGWWYTQNDETSEDQIPPDPWGPTDGDAFTGQFAARLAGSGFTAWGATLGLTLNAECPYDASAFPGIEFWARGLGTTRVRFTTVATVPADIDQGTCQEGCWDDFGASIELTDTWTQYTITWDEITQQGWGEPAEFDPGTLLAIVWQGGGATMNEFDIWIDDIHFIQETQGTETGS